VGYGCIGWKEISGNNIKIAVQRGSYRGLRSEGSIELESNKTIQTLLLTDNH